MINNDIMEYVEASVKFKGFETRIAKVLEPTLIDIQHQTETAVKKALESYDFDTAITHEINLIISRKTKKIVEDTLGKEIYKLMPKLQQSVIEKLKEKLTE